MRLSLDLRGVNVSSFGLNGAGRGKVLPGNSVSGRMLVNGSSTFTSIVSCEYWLSLLMSLVSAESARKCCLRGLGIGTGGLGDMGEASTGE